MLCKVPNVWTTQRASQMRHSRSICGEFDARISQLDAVFCLANSGTKVNYVVNLVEKCPIWFQGW